MKHKSVQVIGYQFDCLPGHTHVTGRGSGATLCVALKRAVGHLFQQLRHKRINSFKLDVVCYADTNIIEQKLDDHRLDKNLCRHKGGVA